MHILTLFLLVSLGIWIILSVPYIKMITEVFILSTIVTFPLYLYLNRSDPFWQQVNGELNVINGNWKGIQQQLDGVPNISGTWSLIRNVGIMVGTFVKIIQLIGKLIGKLWGIVKKVITLIIRQLINLLMYVGTVMILAILLKCLTLTVSFVYHFLYPIPLSS